MRQRREEIIERIKSNVKVCQETECWVWLGRTSGQGNGAGRGYGRMTLGGTTMAVHRVVYTHYFGIILHKKQIDHKCCNRLCCNPDHLEMVTHKQNCKRRDKRNNE